MKALKTIRKGIVKFLIDETFKARIEYTKYFNKLPINEKDVLLQSYEGTSISGNVYYILQELCNNEEYANLNKYVVSNKKQAKNIKNFLTLKGMKNVKVLILHSKQYCKKLIQAKYLINNATFPTYFIKKDEQVYLNTWHGTPLKAMGKNIKNAPNELGNTQRNFLMADYLLQPNTFTFEHIKNDYMLDNLFKGEYLISGYPRNAVFYNEELRNQIKSELKLNDKKIIVYMPTWRGSLINKENDKQLSNIVKILQDLENSIDDNTIIYAKLHNYVENNINYSSYTKIKSFPKEYETYEFLNIADCLITDYSSVFFDFANTGKKIILYAYDKDEYLSDRGLYLDYDKLPFKIVTNTEDLVNQINNIDEYEKYDEFKRIYNNYDQKDTAKIVADYVFSNRKSDKIKIINGREYANNKKNVLIFTGSLAKNGLTTALKGLINNVDKQKYNYILTFYKNKVEKNKNTIRDFKDVIYMPIQGEKNMNVLDILYQFMYFNLNINSEYVKRKIEKMYKTEIERVYPKIKFDYVIHYTGYERQVMNLFKCMDANRIIYIHNDMKKETKLKNNIHVNSFNDALNSFEQIVVIRDTSKKEIIEYNPDIDPEKVKVAHNFNNIEIIKDKALEKVEFESDTYCNIKLETLNQILDDNNYEKFINIARFSPEKGQERLIKAFLEYQKEYNNSYLILIGGNGKKFEKICNIVKKTNNKNIIIIQSIKNPYAILNKCDLFILSSFYEGLPMTIMEALILEKKVISTNIPGPSEFLSQGYGYLVENSENGILKGMKDYKENKLDNLKKFNADEFNDRALKEFEKILQN